MGESYIAQDCAGGEFATPPEDVGGVSGFNEFREIWDNPDDPEYQEMKKWAGKNYDPDV